MRCLSSRSPSTSASCKGKTIRPKRLTGAWPPATLNYTTTPQITQMEVTLQSELTVSTMDVLSLQRWPEESESINEAWYIYFNIWCDIIVYYNSLSSLTFRRRSSCSSFTPPPTCPLLLHRACFQPRFSHLNPSPYDEHVALLDAASGKPAHLQMCLGFFFYAWLPAGQRGIILCPTRQAAYSGSHR